MREQWRGREKEREKESNRKALADSDRYRGAQTRGRCEVGDRADGSSEFHESFTAEQSGISKEVGRKVERSLQRQ